jgi:4'-phosphopantetheinyl transferase
MPEMGVVHLWIADLRDWKIHEENFKSYLSPDEIFRYRRYLIPEKKEQFLYSRGLIRNLLSSYLNVSPESIELSNNHSGKPYLSDANLSFNVSHSSDLLIIGICSGSEIGVDIQNVYPIENPETIIKNTFSQKERTFLSKYQNNDLHIPFFSIWTAKEAYIKALGEGFQKNSKDFSLIPEPSRGVFQLLDPSNKDQESPWTIRSVEVIPGYVAAIAANNPIDHVKSYRYQPNM